MVRSFEASNFDSLFGQIVASLLRNPEYTCEPRGQRILEMISPTLVLTNPRARLLNIKARKADYGFGVGEFLWYWNARFDLESIKYYNKRATTFSNDGTTVNSAYGWRTRGWEILQDMGGYPGDMSSSTQWEAVKKTLIQDPDSRRALLVINLPEDQIEAVTVGSKDVPCTLSLQFFIRNNKLVLHTNMRSNDVIWGLTYDLFSFTLLQEMMMLELNAHGMDLQLGEYIHTAGSLHIYEQHFGMAGAIIDEVCSEGFVPAATMEPLSLDGLATLASEEESLRTRKVESLGEDRFSGGVRWMVQQLEAHRRKRDAERR